MSEVGKESIKNLGYFTSLEGIYKFLIEKDIKEDLTLIENIKKITDLVKELKEFTVSYVDKTRKNDTSI